MEQQQPDRKVDIKDNQLGIKLIPMISTWDQVDPIFPVRNSNSNNNHNNKVIIRACGARSARG
jgi:hypothetical protein